MNPLTYAIVTFVVVLGVTLVSALIILRLWPAIGRDRLTPATTAGGRARNRVASRRS